MRAKTFSREERDQAMEYPCLDWEGAPASHGYGVRKYPGGRMLAHRATWQAHHGAIPEGALVLHHCDNKTCVRIEHLYLGDKRDNALDWSTRTRRTRTPASVRIRAQLMREAGFTQRGIGELLQVNQATVSNWEKSWQSRQSKNSSNDSST